MDSHLRQQLPIHRNLRSREGFEAMFDEKRKQALLDLIEPIPSVQTFGFAFVDVEAGYCKVTMPYKAEFAGRYGAVHGGVLATVADSVAAFAIMTVTGDEQHLTTTDIHIRYLAPCMTEVVAEARTIKVGRTLCPVQVDLFDRDGKPVAVAQVTYMRLDKPQ